MDTEPVVQWIEQQMQKRLITSAELARKAGVSQQRVCNVLKRRTHSIPTIRAMRNALRLGAEEDERAEG